MTCPLGTYCEEHGFHHGAEAEELRKGIEDLIACYEDEVPCSVLEELLQRIDARDSVAYLEARTRSCKI